MNTTTRLDELFETIDRRDTGSFTSFLAEDVSFRFGNMPVLQGREQVRQAIGDFYESIRALKHHVLNTWIDGEVVVCNGNVTYTRHDSSTLTVPFANIFRFNSDLIGEYLIYADISQLYQANDPSAGHRTPD